MIVEHSGWSTDRGWFNDKYEVDTSQNDYVICWKNGTESRQIYGFSIEERDWNWDGDVYELFVAGFEGVYGGISWYTPEDLVRLIVDGEATIEGIKKI